MTNKIRNALPITFALLIALLAGCATMDTTRLTDKVYPAKPADCPIRVYTLRPSERFEEIALLNGQDWASLDSIIPRLKEEACALGADAIVITHSRPYTSTYGSDTHENAKMTATAIKLLPPLAPIRPE